MNVLYIRVSTEEQNEARQTELQNKMNIDKIYIDKASGKNTKRPKLQEMLSFIREGDTVIVESISRLARSTRDLLSIIDKLNEKKVNFISVKENIDTTTAQGRFVLTIFGALAELEREQILERQREGIEIAKREGKYKGRAPIVFDEKEFEKVCGEWVRGNITAVEAQKRMKMNATTFYRKAKERGFSKNNSAE